MAVKYKVIQRGQPGIAGGGERKYYASAQVNGELTLQGLTRNIEQICTVSGADIRAVVYAIVEVIKGTLAEGQIVRLGELGSFRVSIGSEGKETVKEVNAASITGSRIIFTPGQDLKDMLNNMSYEKAR